MTGEVRLFGKGALNLPGAAGMAAGGSVELWPVRGEPAGPMSPKCVRASSVTGNVDMAGSDRSGTWTRRPSVGEDGERPKCVWTSSVAGSAAVAGSDRSGLWVRRPSVGEVGECQRLVRGSLVAGNATMAERPEWAVRSKAVCLCPVGGDAEALGSSGLPGLREVRFWLRCFAVAFVVGGWGFGFRGVAFAGKCRWSRRHIAASVPVYGSFAKSLSVGLFARQFSATRFQKGDDVRGEGAPKIEAVILFAIPPKHRRHTIKNRAAGFADRELIKVARASDGDKVAGLWACDTHGNFAVGNCRQAVRGCGIDRRTGIIDHSCLIFGGDDRPFVRAKAYDFNIPFAPALTDFGREGYAKRL